MLITYLRWGTSLLIGYMMYRDAKSRGDNKELWFLMGFFLNLLGAIIYLVYQMIDRKK